MLWYVLWLDPGYIARDFVRCAGKIRAVGLPGILVPLACKHTTSPYELEATPESSDPCKQVNKAESTGGSGWGRIFRYLVQLADM